MSLPQDAAQASQSSNIIAEREYQAQVIKYESDYNENLAKEKAAAEADAKAAAESKAASDAKAKAAADALAASKKYYAESTPPTRWIYNRGGTRYENPAFTSYEANRPEVLAARAAQSPEANAKQDFLNQYVKSHPYATGKEINIAVHHFESTQLKGMSEKDWNAFRVAEDANRAVALQQSKGLRAAGNAQIKASQTAELARLGGGISPSISNDSRVQNLVAPSAVGTTAAIAQPWGPTFALTPPQAASTPESRFAETATPGVGMFSGLEKKQTMTASPLAKGEDVRNRISPYLITRKVETKPLTNAEKRWAERTGGILTAQQQSKKASDSFAELNNPQEVSRSTPWVVGDKGFFSKGAAERYGVTGGIITGGLVETVPTGTMWNLVGADGKNIKNSHGNELQFKTAESAERYSKILSQRGNPLGYTKSGQPIQGPVQASTSPQFITVPSMGGKSNTVDISGTNYLYGGKIFANEKEVNKYIEKQEANPKLTPTGDTLFGLSKFLDKAALDMRQSENPIVRGIYGGILQVPVEMARIGVELTSSTSNLLEHEVPKYTGVNMPWIKDRGALNPIPTKMTGDEASLPVAFDEKGNQALLGVRLKSGEEYATGFIDYARKYGPGAAITGAATVWVPTGMIIAQIGKSLAKVAIKNTIKNAKNLAIEYSPTSVGVSKPVGMTIKQGDQTFTNVVANPYGKTGRVEYAISQGIAKLKNIKNPITVPYNLRADTLGRKAVVNVSRGIMYVQEKIPTLPTIPQSVKDVGIRIKLAGEDLSTRGVILQRQAKYTIDSKFDRDSRLGVMAEKTQAGVRPISNKLADIKYNAKIGISNVKEQASIVKRKTILGASRFADEQGRIVPVTSQGTGSGFPNLYTPFKAPKSLGVIKQGAIKIGVEVKKGTTRVGTELNKPILYAKYRTQIGISNIRQQGVIAGRQIGRPLRDVKEFGSMINKQDKLLGRQLGLVAKKAGKKVGGKISSEISATKKGIFSVLPEEYTYRQKFIVDNDSKNALRNMTRSEKLALGKPKDYPLPTPRDKSAIGYSTRRKFGETSRASAEQKDVGIFGSKTGVGIKWMDNYGGLGNIKSKWVGGRAGISKSDQKIVDNIFARNKEIGARNKEIKLGLIKDTSDEASTIFPRGTKTPLGRFGNVSGVKRMGPFPKGSPSPLNIRKGAIPADKMSRTNVPILGIGRSTKTSPRTWNRWGKWATDLETKQKKDWGNAWTDWSAELKENQLDYKGYNPLRIKEHPTPIGKDSEEAFQMVARKFREGGKEPTSLESNLGKRNEALKGDKIITKSSNPIKSSPKAKMSAEQFDNPITRTAKINPRQGAFGSTGLKKGVMNKGMMKDIIESHAKNKPSGIASTNKERVINKFDAVEKHDLNKIQQRAKELREMQQDESLFKFKGSKELAIGDKKGILEPSKSKPIFGPLGKPKPIKKGGKTVVEWKPKESDIDLTKKHGEPKNGMISPTGILEPPKGKTRIVPESASPKSADAISPTQGGSQSKGKMILLPPIVKIDRKRKPIQARVAPSFSEYGYVTESVTSVNVASKSDSRLITGIVARQGVKITPVLATRITPKLATRITPSLATRITPIVLQKQPQALKQSEAQKFKSPSPEKASPKLRAAPRFGLKQPTRTRLREVPKEPPRTKAAGIILPPIDDKKGKKKTKNNKENDFLGNTRLGNIEGLFRRSDIIHGDKKIDKQVRKDSKAKFKERGVSFFSKR